MRNTKEMSKIMCMIVAESDHKSVLTDDLSNFGVITFSDSLKKNSIFQIFISKTPLKF